MKTNESEWLMRAIEPVNSQVVIHQDIQAATTEAGIHLAESARTKFRSGVIVAMADDCVKKLKVGDRVGWQRFAGSPLGLKMGDKEATVIVMHENSLTMRIDGDIRITGGDS